MKNFDVGHFTLIAAWFLSLYALVCGLIGAFRRNSRLTESARNAGVLTAAFSGLSLIALAGAFLHHDYRYVYVWRTSNNDMEWYYLISAVWGGMDGSLLLWAALNACYCALALMQLDNVESGVSRALRRWIVPVFASSTCFFLSMVTFVTNPFRMVPEGSNLTDGNGLNPLLQNPSMMIHPPSLYLGFTGFVVPFGFALAALIAGEQGWTPLVRRWTLIAWGFLSMGIVLGGNWAYIELGWGGFWAWDPVENASFLPWLAATAFLHSVMVEERRGMLKIWNSTLAILCYLLAVFGTFLTRSGIVQSVHAFAETEFGWVFLTYLGITAAVSIALILYRRRSLRSDRAIESYLSREAIFLFNNLILLGICFTTFWGVMFPVLSEAILGEKSVVGPPFYNAVNGPLFLLLLFFMGLGPLVSWKKMKVESLWRVARAPAALSLLVFLGAMIAEPGELKAALAFALCAFIGSSVLLEFRRAADVRREIGNAQAGAGDLFRSKSRKFGGLIVHLGVALMGVSIAASSLFKIERDIVMKTGEQVEVGRYALKLTALTEQPGKNYAALIGTVEVIRRETGEKISTMHPERRFYPRSQEVTTEVDIRMTPRDDLYVALAGIGQNNEAVLKVFVNPLQLWLWVGAFIMLSGAVIVIGPRLPAFVSKRAELPAAVEA